MADTTAPGEAEAIRIRRLQLLQVRAILHLMAAEWQIETYFSGSLNTASIVFTPSTKLPMRIFSFGLC